MWACGMGYGFYMNEWDDGGVCYCTYVMGIRGHVGNDINGLAW